MRVKDEVAVVTGAGCGLGRAYALALAKEGAKGFGEARKTMCSQLVALALFTCIDNTLVDFGK